MFAAYGSFNEGCLRFVKLKGQSKHTLVRRLCSFRSHCCWNCCETQGSKLEQVWTCSLPWHSLPFLCSSPGPSKSAQGYQLPEPVVYWLCRQSWWKKSSAFHRSEETCVCAFGWQGDFSELPVLSFGSEPTKGKDTKSLGCQAALAKLLFGAAAAAGLWGWGFAAHMLGKWMWTADSSPEFLCGLGRMQCQQCKNVPLRYCPWDFACSITKIWTDLMKYTLSTTYTLYCEYPVLG